MGFAQADITEVFPPQVVNGQVYLSWAVSDAIPPNTWYQIYINSSLAIVAQSLSAWIAQPPSGTTERIDIGYVAALWGDPWGVDPWGSALGLEYTDYSASLPAAPVRRAYLTWLGGKFESPDLAGFYVYGSSTPGGSINYAKPLATITAYPAGVDTSGWGLAPWGSGTWGYGSSSYSWTSDTLENGVWSYAVIPYDAANNLGTPQTATVTIDAPPFPPALYPDGKTRLTYTLTGWGYLPWGTGPWGNPEVVLTWLPSPG